MMVMPEEHEIGKQPRRVDYTDRVLASGLAADVTRREQQRKMFEYMKGQEI